MAKKKATAKNTTADEALDSIGQPRALKNVDMLKTKLLGTDREDHWQEVLDMEKEIKKELLKRDLATHQGMQLLIDWMIGIVNDTNALLTLAKSNELSDSQRDGLIEKREFIVALVKFLDPKGTRLADLERELEFQLAEPEDEDVNNVKEGEE